MHNASPVNPINYWRNCTEEVWWHCYNWSDSWLEDDLWEPSSLGFQSSFSKTWYLEEVLVSVPWYIAPWEMLLEFYSVWCCFAVLCSAADIHLKQLDRAVCGARFLTGVYLSVTLLVVDLWQYCVCCKRSGVIRCTLLMVLYLDRMCQCGSHAVLYPHISILMSRHTADPRSTARLIFPSQCSLWNDLDDPAIDGAGLAGFMSRANTFLLA